MTNDLVYLQQRANEEAQSATCASSISVANIHGELARQYRARAEALRASVEGPGKLLTLVQES